MNYRDVSFSLTEALIRSQAPAAHAAEQQAPQRPPFTLTVSREAGVPGSTLGAEVGRRLGWTVYDRNILDRIGEELHQPPFALENVDERPSTWFGEAMAALFDKYHVGSSKYLTHLFAVVRGLSLAGRCVIVGRGANFILPPETTLRVRLIADLEYRARTLAQRYSLGEHEAEAKVKTLEHERRAFIRNTFGEDPAEPHHYDVILSVSRLGVSEAADVVADVLRRREAEAARAGQPAVAATA